MEKKQKKKKKKKTGFGWTGPTRIKQLQHTWVERTTANTFRASKLSVYLQADVSLLKNDTRHERTSKIKTPKRTVWSIQ